MDDIATKRFELMNHKLLLELERLGENQIKGRCETCKHREIGIFKDECKFLIYAVKLAGYCHKWEKRI